MIRYLLKRIGIVLVTLWLLSIVVFVLPRIAGDPVYLLLPSDVTETDRDELREELGLNRPLPEQYWIFMKDVVAHGDFGESVYMEEPVAGLIMDRFPATLKLAAATFLFIVPVGVLAAIRKKPIPGRSGANRGDSGSVPAWLLGGHYAHPALIRDLGFVADFWNGRSGYVYHAGHHTGLGQYGSSHPANPIIHAGGAGDGIHNISACQRGIREIRHPETCAQERVHPGGNYGRDDVRISVDRFNRRRKCFYLAWNGKACL
jgi:hypothetical protein